MKSGPDAYHNKDIFRIKWRKSNVQNDSHYVKCYAIRSALQWHDLFLIVSFYFCCKIIHFSFKSYCMKSAKSWTHAWQCDLWFDQMKSSATKIIERKSKTKEIKEPWKSFSGKEFQIPMLVLMLFFFRINSVLNFVLVLLVINFNCQLPFMSNSFWMRLFDIPEIK